MNKYDFIQKLADYDVAAILASCGLALRKDIALVDALEEMWFVEIFLEDFDEIQDFTRSEICHLASLCLARLTKGEST